MVVHYPKSIRPGHPPRLKRPRTDGTPRLLYDWWRLSGQTQRECADILGVSLRTFQRWISQESKPQGMSAAWLEKRLEEEGVRLYVDRRIRSVCQSKM